MSRRVSVISILEQQPDAQQLVHNSNLRQEESNSSRLNIDERAVQTTRSSIFKERKEMVNTNYTRYNPRNPVQTDKAVKGQKKNNAGGFVFTITPQQRAERFLILGGDSNYYTAGTKLVKENAKNLIELIGEGHSAWLVDKVVEISTAGRAVKQDAGLFALAVASSYGSTAEKQYALSKLNQVARTGTALFTFVTYALLFRSWGRALKRAVGQWYTANYTDENLAYQLVKYRQRDGWTHRDLLRLTHPTASDASINALLRWAVKGELSEVEASVILGYEKIGKNAEVETIIDAIREYNLPWEALPTDSLTDKRVWVALILTGNLPLTALIRNLVRLQNLGVFEDEKALARVVKALTDEQYVQKSRIHPVSVLTALNMYIRGTETQSAPVLKALEEAFELAFKNVDEIKGNVLVGLDVSGSMGWSKVGTALSARDIGAALAVVLARKSEDCAIFGFSGRFIPLPINARTTVEEAVAVTSDLPFENTDCALPMIHARENRLDVDTFVIITDNETYYGKTHPFKALQQYRQAMNKPNAKLIVLATTATKFSIADPSDAGMLDIAGFDSAVPQLIEKFANL